MKIENEKIILRPYEKSRFQHLKSDQLEILELFFRSYSVFEVAQHYFSRGQLVSFQSIRQVIEMLLADQLIINVSFYDYFKKHKTAIPDFFSKITDQLFSTEKAVVPEKEKIAKVPFFRSLNPEILTVFLQNSSLVEVPAGITLCQEGAYERSLLVLLQGQASVFKKDPIGNQKRWVVLNESSLFGEAAFFFGEPRSASVITDKPSQVLVIKYIPEKYDDMIKTDKARRLQLRIWAIHALLKSEMFRALPQECFDALIFSGELKTFAPGTLICKQGDVGKTCYVIIQGSVNVIKNLTFIRSLGQGDSFGEIALTLTRGQRTASVQSVTEVMALEIEMNQFYKMLSENLILGCEFEKLALKRLQQ